MKVKRVAVIGAGSAGLAGARRLLEDPARFSCTVFEQTGAIGGTWVYNEHVGKDEFGLPLHTSMYKNLRVNVPKDIMGYPGYQVPELDGRSYISAEEFLQFLNDFADHFRIRERVRFYHRVQRVVPTESGGWKVFTTDLLAKEDKEEEFDAVMVCNGHFFEPFVPAIPGADAFEGQSLHSHDFRVPEPFKDLNVVVVGGRASAMDVCLMVARAGAASVLLSHNWQDPMPVGFPANARQAPGVARLGTRSAHFEDGSEAQCDVIIYCTGYLYSFPFLGDLVRVVDNHVQLLYKHVVHIDYPTLAFIGLPSLVCTNPLFDLQVRFFLSTVAGTALLPSREEMLAELERDIELRKEKGLKPRHAHSMGSFQGDYYKSLAESGKVEPLPPVYAKLHYHSMMRFRDDFVNFRENYYEIVDDENFIFIENK